jgi:ubiquinol-cytochrome c reductase cytochrome c1 subunit
MKALVLVLLSAVGIAHAADYRPTSDPAAVGRGAVLFMESCANCHSLKYLSYEQLHRDLGLTSAQTKTYQDLTQSHAASPIRAQLTPELTQKMFGLVPPDLTLVTHARSPDWVYRYLLGFYPDSSRPSGVNNHVYPNAVMPDVLAPLHQQVGDQAFAAKVGDLVSFLAYSADPQAATRKIYGLWVLLFLIIFLLPVYLLQREYWKDLDTSRKERLPPEIL